MSIPSTTSHPSLLPRSTPLSPIQPKLRRKEGPFKCHLAITSLMLEIKENSARWGHQTAKMELRVLSRRERRRKARRSPGGSKRECPWALPSSLRREIMTLKPKWRDKSRSNSLNFSWFSIVPIPPFYSISGPSKTFWSTSGSIWELF